MVEDADSGLEGVFWNSTPPSGTKLVLVKSKDEFGELKRSY